MKWKAGVWLCAAILTAAGLLTALTQTAFAADPPPPACGYGQLQVRVTDKKTGAPLPGQQPYASSKNSDFFLSGLTDQDGFITFNTRADQRDAVFTLLVYGQDGYQDFMLPEPVTVMSGTLTRRDVALEQGGVLSGKLANVVTSEPLTKASVTLYMWNPVLDAPSAVGSARAEEDGSFSISGLSSGSYALRVTADNPDLLVDDVEQCQNYLRITYSGGALQLEDAEYYTVTAPNTLTIPEIQLQAGSTISGTVRRADTSTPLPLANITAMTSDGAFVDYGRSTSWQGGRYCIGGLAPDDYILLAEPPINPWPSDLQPEWYQDARIMKDAQLIQLTDQVEANFELEVGGTITGQIMDAVTSGPVDDAEVSLRPHPCEDCIYRAFAGFGRAEVDDDGTYEIAGIPAGDYVVEFSGSPFENYLSAYYSQEPDGSPTLVRVTAGETVGGIDGSLPKGGIITGRVTDGMGDPLDDVWIDVRTSDGELIRTRFTNAQGEYSVSLLESGGYSLFFGISKVCECYAEKYYNSTPGASGPELVQVTAGETTDNIDVVLECSTTPPPDMLNSFLPFISTK
jgi:hypothetical protein